MTDFAAMAAKAKAERDARTADEAQKSEKAQRERDVFVDNAIAKIEERVLPILERARLDFSAQGIESQIVKIYDVRSRYSIANPALKFSCFSPERPSDGYKRETPPAFFASDGNEISVGLASASYDRESKIEIGRSPAAESEGLITEGIERVVVAYFEMIEAHKHALK